VNKGVKNVLITGLCYLYFDLEVGSACIPVTIQDAKISKAQSEQILCISEDKTG